MARKSVKEARAGAMAVATLLAATLGFAARAQAPAAPKAKYKTTVLRPFERAVITVRYADPDKTEPPGPDEALPITVTVSGDWRPGARTATIQGVKGWQPWLFESATMRDLDGDKMKEVFVRAACHYGGSGGYQYLAVLRQVRIPNRGYEMSVLPPVASENIHEGQFFAASDGKGHALIVATTPLMDNETRADPTHWRVSGYVLDGDPAPTVAWTKTPPKKYSEFAPVAAIKSALPRGWRLGAEIR